MGPISCPETFARKRQSKLRKIPNDSISHYSAVKTWNHAQYILASFIIIIMFRRDWACFLFLDSQDKIGPSISSSVALCSFVVLVHIVALVLVFYLCASSVRVVDTFPGTVLFPLLCSVLSLFMFCYLFKHIKYILFRGATVPSGSGPPHYWSFSTHSVRNITFVEIPWTREHHVAGTSTWQHTTLTRDRLASPRRDSNSQSQQASDRRPTP
jgi:hypothetical protein